MCPFPTNIDISLIFSRSPLGHEPRGKRGAARAVYQVESELGISFLKLADGKPGIINNVNHHLTLRLRRLQRFLPLNLPDWSGLSGACSSARNEEEQGDTHTKKKYSFHRRFIPSRI